MKVSASIFLALLCAMTPSLGQSNSRAGDDAVAPLPKAQCSFDRKRPEFLFW